MSNRQYYQNPFLTELKTTIVDHKVQADQVHVVLQDTIFYPTGGGQPSDTGFIDEQPVCDVYEQEGIIYHVIPVLPQQDSVTCKLNWERRLYHMQHHSGQHLLSAICENNYGWATASFHLGEEYASIDITTNPPAPESIAEIEIACNAAIQANLKITTSIVTVAEATKLPVRKLPTVKENIRIVQIGELDYSPCGGTHLASSGQIGLLKIIKVEKYKDMTRLYFLCGTKAMDDYNTKHSILTTLATQFSVGIDDLLNRIDQEKERSKKLEQENKQYKAELLIFQARALVAQASSEIIIVDRPDLTVQDAQHLAGHILELGSFFVLIQVSPRLVLATNLRDKFHCGDIVKKHAAQFSGRGGGSAQMGQAFFPTEEQLLQFIDYVQTQITQSK